MSSLNEIENKNTLLSLRSSLKNLEEELLVKISLLLASKEKNNLSLTLSKELLEKISLLDCAEEKSILKSKNFENEIAKLMLSKDLSDRHLDTVKVSNYVDEVLNGKFEVDKFFVEICKKKYPDLPSFIFEQVKEAYLDIQKTYF